MDGTISVDISRPESKFNMFPSNFETGVPGISTCVFFCSLIERVTVQPGFLMGSHGFLIAPLLEEKALERREGLK